MLVPEGARAATSRMSRIVSSSTVSGRKARTERRDRIASSTIAGLVQSRLASLSRDSMFVVPDLGRRGSASTASVRAEPLHQPPQSAQANLVPIMKILLIFSSQSAFDEIRSEFFMRT